VCDEEDEHLGKRRSERQTKREREREEIKELGSNKKLHFDNEELRCTLQQAGRVL
jgi:hypothetical protein